MQAAASSPDSVKPVVKSTVRADLRSGRLVRSTVVERAIGRPPAQSPEISEIIDRIAAEQGVEGPLVHSVARAESNYDPLAVSPKGAEGVMQLEPETARRFGVANSFDPVENIRGGVKYLRFLLDYYGGDYTKAIAAYNAGEKAVDRYQGAPPYAETRDYIARVAKNLKRAREAHDRPDLKPRGGLRPAGTTETYRPIQTSVGSDGKIYYRTP